MALAVFAVGVFGHWAVSSAAGLSPLAGDAVSPEAASRRIAEPHVVVLKSKRELLLFDRDRLVRKYPIQLGFNPAGDKRFDGDGRTPEGQFRICSRRSDSPYRHFLGIDYPNADTARRAALDGVLSLGEAIAIDRANTDDRCPTWRTPAGGAIGIHGQPSEQLAGGERRGDWTAGCIATADQHMDELFAVLRIGDRVEILP